MNMLRSVSYVNVGLRSGSHAMFAVRRLRSPTSPSARSEPLFLSRRVVASRGRQKRKGRHSAARVLFKESKHYAIYAWVSIDISAPTFIMAKISAGIAMRDGSPKKAHRQPPPEARAAVS
jgi:hypothetical protein